MKILYRIKYIIWIGVITILLQPATMASMHFVHAGVLMDSSTDSYEVMEINLPMLSVEINASVLMKRQLDAQMDSHNCCDESFNPVMDHCMNACCVLLNVVGIQYLTLQEVLPFTPDEYWYSLMLLLDNPPPITA